MKLYIVILILSICGHVMSIHGLNGLCCCGGVIKRRNDLRMIIFGGWSSGILDFFLIYNLFYQYFGYNLILSILVGIFSSFIIYFIQLIIINIIISIINR